MYHNDEEDHAKVSVLKHIQAMMGKHMAGKLMPSKSQEHEKDASAVDAAAHDGDMVESKLGLDGHADQVRTTAPVIHRDELIGHKNADDQEGDIADKLDDESDEPESMANEAADAHKQMGKGLHSQEHDTQDESEHETDPENVKVRAMLARRFGGRKKH